MIISFNNQGPKKLNIALSLSKIFQFYLLLASILQIHHLATFIALVICEEGINGIFTAFSYEVGYPTQVRSRLQW